MHYVFKALKFSMDRIFSGEYIFQNIPPWGGGNMEKLALAEKNEKIEEGKKKNRRRRENGKEKGRKGGKMEKIYKT